MIVVAETPYYSRRAASIMNEGERNAVIEMVARAPVALEGRGKSGGARLIYYYQNDAWPVLLLEVFAKNEKANLSQAQRNTLAKLISELKAARKG